VTEHADLPPDPRRDVRRTGVPPAPRGRHLRARDAVLVVALTALLLLLVEGASIRDSGEEMQPGWQRSMVLAVGHPAGWISETIGLAEVRDSVVRWAKDEDAADAPGFDDTAGAPATGSTRQIPPVTADAFDPVQLGARPAAPATLKTLLVTGDSLAMPLDAELARRMARAGGAVEVVRDPRVGTGISQSELVDWGSLSAEQTRDERPQATVMFLGANEGFPITVGGRSLECCGPQWATAYANRARRMMATYRADGRNRVYWLLVPAPRDPERQRIARAVNAAVAVAAQPFRAQVRVLDTNALVAPDGRYRDAIEVDGREQIVRDADGVHLNQRGAELAADRVLAALRADFGASVPGG
jgi:hypothetical protein